LQERQKLRVSESKTELVLALPSKSSFDKKSKKRQEVSIGRVITTERGKGYGKQIMIHAIEAAHSLLRCLNELKQEGVIRVEGRHIHILSPLLIS
jgi:predicted GNAT family N-acyltransferase